MIPLSIIAAGIIAIAAALFLRPSFELRKADQQGITLQTLIVTAVLVLMAGAAGVVIIAITNNARDNLADQDTNIASRCEPWEVFDPTLSAAGRGGGNEGIDSSAIGCIRVCYVEFWHATAADTAALLTNAKLIDILDAGTPTAVAKGRLMYSRSDLFKHGGKTAAGLSTVPVSGLLSVDVDGNGNGDDATTKADIAKIKGGGTANFEIRVATNQRYCEVWNTTNEQQEFRSKN